MSSRREFIRSSLGAGLLATPYPRVAPPPVSPPGVSVMAFGAAGDGSIDDTEAFRQALAAADHVDAPAGIYRVDGTIALGPEKHLSLAPDATLLRVAGGADTPVVRLAANHCSLTGGGWVRSNVVTPRGVVHVGPAGPEDPSNINWARIRDIRISGVHRPGSVGLQLSSSEATARGSNYNGSFSDLYIQLVETAIDLGPYCNAHTFINAFFYRVLKHCYRVRRGGENTFFGGFTHFSPGVTVIQLEGALYNLFYGVQAEPGAGSRYYYVDNISLHCQILGHNNCTDRPVMLSRSSTFIGNGRIVAPTIGTNHLNAGTLRSTFQVTRVAPDRPGLSEQVYQPFVLNDTSKRGIRVAGLRRASADAHHAALAFEILISGHAAGNGDDAVYTAKTLVTAYNRARNEPRIDVRDLVPLASNLERRVDTAASAVEFELRDFQGSESGEVLCEVRKIGLAHADVVIEAL